jgi:rhamnose transport system permease protein
VTTIQTAKPPRVNWLVSVLRVRELTLGIIILVMIFGIYLRAPGFLRPDNIDDILLGISILVIVALGQTAVILTKGIDLSVASIIALVAMMVGYFAKQYPTMPWFLYIALGIGLGAMLGMFNGLVVAFGKVPPIITTLGTMSIFRGLVFYYSGGAQVNSYEIPDSVRWITHGSPLILHNLVIFAIVIAIAAYFFLKYTRVGRNLFAIGSNPDAAVMVGIRSQRYLFLVYLISGLACGLAGVLWLSRYASAQANSALGFELQSVAASIVGGVSISGGVGTVPGVLLGSLLMGVLQNGLTIIRISPFWQLAAQGLLILLAVITDTLVLRGMQRQQRTRQQ